MSEYISSSQLSTWMRCPKQYEFRYLCGYKLPPRAGLTRGSACHRAWEYDHRHKMEQKQNLPLDEVLDVFSDHFEQLATETQWDVGEDKGRIKDAGVRMVEVYHDRVSRRVQPIACEESFEITIGEHVVQGVIDLETETGEIRDAKTTTRRKLNIPIEHQLQMAIYSRAKPDAKAFVLDNAIVSERESNLESLTLTRDGLPQKRLDAYLNAFGESLKHGHFPPTNPENWWCSQKWCGYYGMCKFGSGTK